MGRELQEFKSLTPGVVKMYTCGPTVWNYAHIGNFRAFIFEDLLRRFLKYNGYKVIQVKNLTDVDDRIIKICNEEDIERLDLVKKYSKAFFKDMDFLKIERAEYYPYATDSIPEMVKLVSSLVAKGYAYKADDLSIYFNIAKFKQYGKLSGLKVSELKPGARVKQDDYEKTSAEDFALWKAWDENDGKIFWETELGKGRPGWHIECSAMSLKYLGEEFDIHTGGVDLIFPHHENEIAQSESYTGKKVARYWLHSAHLLVNGQKMAKRLGNFITIPDLREKGINGEALRFLLLSAKYRDQLNFTEESMKQALASVQRINEFALRLEEAIKSENTLKPREEVRDLIRTTRSDFVSALENDLDTPRALAVIFEFITRANKILDEQVSSTDAKLIWEFLRSDFDSIFGVLREVSKETSLSPEIFSLLKQREEARKSRDWKLADSLRNNLLDLGIEVQDTPEGQKWRKRN
jgi:cysteinyl-tRNA synthetase